MAEEKKVKETAKEEVKVAVEEVVRETTKEDKDIIGLKEAKVEKDFKEVEKDSKANKVFEAKNVKTSKKKGTVISVGKVSIVVKGEKGEGLKLFGYKGVKVGDTVEY